jgi:exodeoxyribonuclease VII small subunit
MAKRKAQTDAEGTPEIGLEEAMAELSQIVSRLESGQATLDESLAQFERGMSLLRTCHRKLDVAAQRIELVTQLSAEGEVLTEEFDSTSTLQRSASADAARAARKTPKPDAEDDDGGLLF